MLLKIKNIVVGKFKSADETSDYLYHVTYFVNLAAIAMHGLQPNMDRSLGGEGYNHHAKGKIFLTEKQGVPFWVQRAEEFAHHKSDDVLADKLIPVVIRVNTEKLAEDSLDQDDLGTKDSNVDAWMSIHGIPADYLEVFDGSNWVSIENWTNLDIKSSVDDEYGFVASPPITKIASATVTVNYDKAVKAIKDDLEDLVEWSAKRKSEYPYTEEHANADIAHITELIKADAQAAKTWITNVIDHLSNWTGSQVELETRISDVKNIQDDEGEYRKFNDFEVIFPGKVSFTLFGVGQENHVDDVLDAGDQDFFTDPNIEADYFSLVAEIKHPGLAAKQAEKIITVYTARPKQDRSLYEHATKVPVNVFLTTSENEAIGYSIDLGGDRDLYMLRIKKKYIIEAADFKSHKNYQTFSAHEKFVPVESIERIE